MFAIPWLFSLPARGDLIALLAAPPLYSAAHLILGFAFSALVESQLQAIEAAFFFYLPSMLLSGFMFPFEGMQAWARTVGAALPLTHFVRATRGVLLKGEGASLVVSEMSSVAVFALSPRRSHMQPTGAASNKALENLGLPSRSPASVAARGVHCSGAEKKLCNILEVPEKYDV